MVLELVTMLTTIIGVGGCLGVFEGIFFTASWGIYAKALKTYSTFPSSFCPHLSQYFDLDFGLNRLADGMDKLFNLFIK